MDLANVTRQHRHARFLRLIRRLGNRPRLLDVGGTSDYWQTMGIPDGIALDIVLLNLCSQPASVHRTVVGDARDLSRFADRSFDIVFSNSVIGHVGTFNDQMSMAQHMRRVGRHFFLQTPNHGFPVDWRTLVPFFHFLPASVQSWAFEHLSVGRYPRAVSAHEAWDWATRVRNVRRQELRRLFPGAMVEEERVLGFTKSFMVHDL